MSTYIKGVMILTKKEVRDAFKSPLIYILAGLFCIITGWLFFNYLIISKELTQKTLFQSVLIPIFGNINFIFLFLAPLITMRMFSEEKKLHTLSLLYLSDLTDLQIIVGKFLSSLIMILFLLSFTLIFPLILSFSGYSNWAVVFSAYGGTVLSVMCYLAVGLFASSLTENQIVAALLSFCILLGLMLFVLTSNATNNYILGQILSYISIPYHYEAFVRGAIKLHSFVYLFSFMGFFFYMTKTALKSRKW